MQNYWLYPASSEPPEALALPVASETRTAVTFTETVLYQASTEPIESLGAAEVPQLDKWLPWTNQNPWLSLAIHPSVIPFEASPPNFTGAEQITVDKWLPRSQDPLFARPFLRALYPNSDRRDVSETGEAKVPWDRYRSMAVPVFAAHPLAPLPRLDTKREEDLAEQVTIDKWYTALSTPLFAVLRLLPQPPIETKHPEELAEQITLDKWNSPLSEPIFPVDPFVEPEMGFLLMEGDLSEFVLVASWDTGLSVPTLPPQEPITTQHRMDAEPIPDEALLPTRIPWYTPFSLPLPEPTLRPIPQFQYKREEDLVEGVHLDAFETPLLDLPREAARLPVGVQPLDVGDDTPRDESITLDKWYTRLSVPMLPPRAFRELYDPFLLMTGDLTQVVTVDMWYTALGVPTLPLDEPVTVFNRMDPEPIPDIPGLFLDWNVALTQPIFVPPPTPFDQVLQNLQRVEFIAAADGPRFRADEIAGDRRLRADEAFDRRHRADEVFERRQRAPRDPDKR